MASRGPLHPLRGPPFPARSLQPPNLRGRQGQRGQFDPTALALALASASMASLQASGAGMSFRGIQLSNSPSPGLNPSSPAALNTEGTMPGTFSGKM
mmetsp:Transcript_122812/g.342202  ORF Transcript_122812/g.342202 Transcript_122812/m.342202 type:complete len:97 (-) Transcript_122812:793-1083(-)